MSHDNSKLPLARRDGLLVEELGDETLVYDRESHEAHCLNRSAALVWRHCDGTTTVADMVSLLQQELDIPADESMVWLALDRVEKAQLLRQPPTPARPGIDYSRRAVIRTLGRAGGIALVVPVVASIVAPHAAHAQSCIERAACEALLPPNCGGMPICDRPGDCCMQDGDECDKDNCP